MLQLTHSYNDLLCTRVATDDEATMQEMKRLCDKITEMQKQRQMFEQQFRDELLKDDLTATLVTHVDKNQEVRPHCSVLYCCVTFYVFFTIDIFTVLQHNR